MSIIQKMRYFDKAISGLVPKKTQEHLARQSVVSFLEEADLKTEGE